MHHVLKRRDMIYAEIFITARLLHINLNGFDIPRAIEIQKLLEGLILLLFFGPANRISEMLAIARISYTDHTSGRQICR